jgi:GNAT superfamily N-acetyltransferase
MRGSPAPLPPTEDYYFAVTGYAGFEDEILAFRNGNRETPRTRSYLDWRYLGGSSRVPEPLVFWLRSASGEAVGMASMIFRPYLVDGRATALGVIGDISLDERLRGKGMGRLLLDYVRRHLDEHLPGCAALVIPNEAARKSLVASGWETGGAIVPYVLPRAERFSDAPESKRLAHAATRLWELLAALAARWQARKGYTLQIADGPDDSFTALWQTVRPEGLVLSDRGAESLDWRYARHPHSRFGVAQLLKGDGLMGYVAFTLSLSDGTCYVYDLLVREENDLACMLGLFLLHVLRQGGVRAIRLPLSDAHPYRGTLWRLGFVRRTEDRGTFLLHRPEGFPSGASLRWALSQGDKDV